MGYVEVHSGSRPGRPVILLLVTASFLALSLALAGWQTVDRRRLGEPVALPDSPLVVRPPAGWVRHPDEPGLWIQRSQLQLDGADAKPLQRTIRVTYRRHSWFRDPIDLLRLETRQDVDAPAISKRQARIGPLHAIQVIREYYIPMGQVVISSSTIFRQAVTGRGDQITVEYNPLGEVSMGDERLFDAFCRAIEIRDPALTINSADALRATGLAFDLAPEWRVYGADLPGVPALTIEGVGAADTLPHWSIGVLRTWLAEGQTGRGLLLATLREWTADIEEQDLQPPARVADRVIHSYAAKALRASFRVLELEDGAVVLLHAAAGEDHFAVADQIATEVALAVRQTAADEAIFGDAAVARARGAKILADVRGTGLADTLGAPSYESYWWVRQPGFPNRQVLRLAWALARDDGEVGLVREVALRGARRGDDWDSQSWVTDDLGRFDLLFQRDVRVRQRGDRKAGSVLLEIGEADAARREEFAWNANTLPTPADETVEWLTARGGEPARFRTIPLFGGSSGERLVRPLTSEDSGVFRVLLIENHWPRGTIAAYDDAGRIVATRQPGREFEACDAAVGREAFERW